MTQAEIIENFAHNVRELRKKKGVTQTQFASLIGVTQKNIGSWEERRAIPPLELVYRISQLFNVRLDKLIGEKLSLKQQA